MPARRTVSIIPEQDVPLRAVLATGRRRGAGEIPRSTGRLPQRDEAAARSTIENAAVSREAIRG